MFDFQTHFIFPGPCRGRAGPLPRTAERLSVVTPDGETLQGVRIPPDAPDKSEP